MKILFSHRIASRDGQAVHLEELIASFRHLGHEVIVVGPKFSKRQKFGDENRTLSFARRYFPSAILELLEFSYSFVAFLHLQKAYRMHRPDVLYERFNLFYMAGAWLKRKYNIPYFLEVNAPIFEERKAHDGLALKRFAKWCQQTVWRSADQTLPVSHALAEYLFLAGVRTDQVTVVPNGIDPDRFMLDFDRERQKTVLGLGGKIVVGFTGFIRDWHGLERVIDWLSESDSGALVQLVVIGDGPARSALEQYAASRRVQDQVLFTGLVERSDIPLMVSAFDVALQPGVTAYASPLKIMEYMALGCAIVAPRQPTIEEILTDGETALLFDPESPKSMRDCIERLCADRDLRLRLASASRAMILELNLTWDSNAKRLERLFSEALAD